MKKNLRYKKKINTGKPSFFEILKSKRKLGLPRDRISFSVSVRVADL